MHVRVRLIGQPDAIVVVESKLTKIEKFRQILQEKFKVKPHLQRLFYGGKLLENGYTFHDYNIKLNDVIQFIVRQQASPEPNKTEAETSGTDKKQENKIEYTDAESIFFSIGDFIDMKDKEQGAWFEGKVVRIVHDPDTPDNNTTSGRDDKQNKENDPENIQTGANHEKPKNGITMYFGKAAKKLASEKNTNDIKTDCNLYEVQVEGDEDGPNTYCKLKELRPRARTVIDVKDLKIGQKVMVNYNAEQPREKGYWYDFKVSEIVKKLRNTYGLIGTVYLGPDAVPQNETKIALHDKIFAIEELVPLEDRTKEYRDLMKTQPEKRSSPLNCLTCRDDEEAPCKDCGCYLCSGKEFPEKIVLCDECNRGYHMACLDPPIEELPDEDWYCPACKRDPNDVVAPGAAKQTKKRQTKGNRDWGRGMACAGKTKTCSMPPNHFGPIPGIEVGMCWRFRIQLSESGVHRPPVSGIHGRDVEGAYSIVLSGGYEDDVDQGYEFTYTGSGGRDLSGNKRTAEQSCDQTLTRENKALARNCAVKKVNEEGDDAGELWKEGRPVRVVRSYKMQKYFPQYAPSEGIRYDGIYKVVKYYPEKGISGFRVWKYLLRRDDPSPAPWEPNAKQFTIIYPDGYLEAEAVKKALKEKHGKGKGSKIKKHSSGDESSPPAKRQKGDTLLSQTSATPDSDKPKRKGPPPKLECLPIVKTPFGFGFTQGKPPAKSPEPEPLSAKSSSGSETALGQEVRDAIKADTRNSTLWEECLNVLEKKGKKEFVEHVSSAFFCIICQEVAVRPVTTPCLHIFCLACLKQAFKTTGHQTCPCCRRTMAKSDLETNEELKSALRSVLAGYDAGYKDELDQGFGCKNKPSRGFDLSGNNLVEEHAYEQNKERKYKVEKYYTAKGTCNYRVWSCREETQPQSPKSRCGSETTLCQEERDAIRADTQNFSLWGECLEVYENKGKKEFIKFVKSTFLCIICQEVVVRPVTTPCFHNFCMECIKQAFQTQEGTCPCCQYPISKSDLGPNDELKSALRSVLADYDAGGDKDEVDQGYGCTNKPSRGFDLSGNVVAEHSYDQNKKPKYKVEKYYTAKGTCNYRVWSCREETQPQSSRWSETALGQEERDAIKADTRNFTLWGECLDVYDNEGKKEFVEFVCITFLCIICQEVAVRPVTTPCFHNFCLECIKQSFETQEGTCPRCQYPISKSDLEPNDELKNALGSVLADYDAGKK